MATDIDPNSFVSEGEAGRILGGDKPIKPRTLQRWRVEGDGPPYHKFRHAVRYRVNELLAWAEAQRRTANGKAA